MSVVRARKSTKEMVYRRSLTAPFLEFRKSQVGIDRVEVSVRRNNKNVVGWQRRCVADLLDGESNMRLRQIRKVAFKFRGKMNNSTNARPRQEAPGQRTS